MDNREGEPKLSLTSPAEILLGRPRADWRARDYWVLRAGGAALGAAGWILLAFLVALLRPRYSNPLPFALALAAAAAFWVFLFLLLTVKGPRRKPQPPA